MNKFTPLSTPTQAYWLGLLYADGNLHISKRGQKTVNIALKDKVPIEQFKMFLGKQNKITVSKTGLYGLYLCDKTLYDELAALGLFPKKSLTLKFPQILPEELIPHFVRGFFDGDGCVSAKGNNRIRIHFVSSAHFIQSLQDYLIKKLGISKTKLLKTRNSWNLHIGKQLDVKKVYEFMYPNENVVAFERKKKIFTSFYKVS